MSEPKLDQLTRVNIKKSPLLPVKEGIKRGAQNPGATEKLPSEDNDPDEPYGFYRNWNSETDVRPTVYPPQEDPWREGEVANADTQLIPQVVDEPVKAKAESTVRIDLPQRGGRHHRGLHTRKAYSQRQK